MHRLARLTLAPLAALVLALGACGDSSGGPADDLSATDADAVGIRVVSPAEAADVLADDPSPTLIDVRTPEEYAAGHLEGAVLIDFNADDFADRIAELDPAGRYVIYCRSGNRSAGARAVMTDLGFTDVADIDGGIVAWTAAGLPVVTG